MIKNNNNDSDNYNQNNKKFILGKTYFQKF